VQVALIEAGMASRRLTVCQMARLATMRRMRRSLSEADRTLWSRSVTAASQSMSTSGVPSLMVGTVLT